MAQLRQAVPPTRDTAAGDDTATAESGAEKHTQMANAIRALAMDAVQKANSGHPGMPMGMADVATVLFNRFVKFDPTHPNWPDRDRVVLSAGHGSMLLYACLHLLGYEDFTIDELKRFRQLGAKTAGHPEYGHGAGIETTTGPLGQGLSNAVGMALAERILAARFSEEIVDHHTYVMASDGDLMEGISHEAISLAGHLRLGKLIVLFDDNGISIDGPLTLAETGDQLARFEAMGWSVARIDGHDADAIETAIAAAQKTGQPSLIACQTRIGYGAPSKEGSSAAHGAPLGEDEIKGAREALGWQHKPFEVPSDVRDAWRLTGLRNVQLRKRWEKRLNSLDSEPRAEFERAERGELPAALANVIGELKQALAAGPKDIATRNASQDVLDVLTPVLPEMIGGSADLTGSNNTLAKGMTAITPDDFSGRFIHYGVREHAMAAAMNGMALHRGLIPYSGTFLVFSDYCRPSIRLAALMRQRVIHVMTHDSIGLGEDGPTHQPVEHLAALRAIPDLNVFRPADATETAECWQLALESHDRPSVIALSRQKLPALRTNYSKENLCARGAYEIASADREAEVTIFASGSEVHLALAAKAALDGLDRPTRVVSVPCFELFVAQDEGVRERIIGKARVKIGVEAAIAMGWERFIGPDGLFIGMSGFGASGPYQELYAHFGITAEAIVATALERLGIETGEEPSNV